MAEPTMTPAEARFFAEKAIAENMPMLIGTVVALAAEGDLAAAKLLINKLVPDAKPVADLFDEDAPVPELKVILSGSKAD
jgi:hypothetical protein